MASADDRNWEAASWEGAARATLLAGARLTLAERLAWLEEAAEVARWLGKARERAGFPAAAVAPDPREGPSR